MGKRNKYTIDEAPIQKKNFNFVLISVVGEEAIAQSNDFGDVMNAELEQMRFVIRGRSY